MDDQILEITKIRRSKINIQCHVYNNNVIKLSSRELEDITFQIPYTQQ